MDPRPPRLNETITLDNIAAPCQVVRVANDQIRPDTIPAAGTAYNSVDNKLPNRIGQDIWGNYKYGWPIEAPTDYSAFVFVPALPTTPVVKPRNDAIWGPVIDHTYYCLRSDQLPDVADTNVALLGTDYLSRHVIAVSEPREMSGEVIEVTITSAATSTVTITESPVDDATGKSYSTTRLYTVSATKPNGADVDLNSEFTVVTRERHNLWLSVTDKASTLATSRDLAVPWDSVGRMYWPAVLQSYEFKKVVAQDLTNWTKILVRNMRDPYSNDVRVTNRLWWQRDPYTIPALDPMIPSGINVRGNVETFSIEPCLHGPFEYEEENFTANLNASVGTITHVMTQFQFAATTHTDWPETITRVEQSYKNGGYECFEQIYERPLGHTTSEATIFDREWTVSDGIWYRY